MQAATGQTLAGWQHGLNVLDADSVAGLVWLRRGAARVRPTCVFADVEFDLGTFDASEDETPVPPEPTDPGGST